MVYLTTLTHFAIRYGTLCSTVRQISLPAEYLKA
jgi:hypothetical protein